MEDKIYYGKLYKLCVEYVKMMEIRHWLKFGVDGPDDCLIEDVESEIEGLVDDMRKVLSR